MAEKSNKGLSSTLMIIIVVLILIILQIIIWQGLEFFKKPGEKEIITGTEENKNECDLIEETADKLLEQSNYCQKSSDCKITDEAINCHSLISIESDTKDFKKEIRKYKASFIEKKCPVKETSCPPLPEIAEIKCIDNKCVQPESDFKICQLPSVFGCKETDNKENVCGCVPQCGEGEPLIVSVGEGNWPDDSKKGVFNCVSSLLGKECVNNEGCGENLCCWKTPPLGPQEGIPGSNENPGKCGACNTW